MIVTLERSGGFAAIPGLSRPIVLDTDGLPDERAEELCRLVAAVEREPEEIPPPPGAADFRSFHLRVESAGQTWSVRFTDARADDPLRALVRWLEECL